MAKLRIPEHSTKTMSYNREDNTLVTEHSDMGSPWPLYGQVYDDACDEGLMLVSHKTGTKMLFCLEKMDKNPDGEIQGWWFFHWDNAIPWEKRMRLLIIND